MLAAIAAAAALALSALPATAHPMSPVLLQLRELGGGTYELTWRESMFKLPQAAEKRPILPPHCQPSSPQRELDDPNALKLMWTVDCGAAGLVGRRVGVEGLGDTGTDALIRVEFADGRIARSVVGASDPFTVVPERESASTVVAAYARLGVEHIASGIDHLLFVFGLLLLVTSARSLVGTITAFTLGHSVTLTLAVLGLANAPSGPVEVLIATSVFVLAVEIARERRSGVRGPMGRNPWFMAALFGLLHGLGFAGALSEIGLPQYEIPLALLAFNLGIEFGQLLFVGTVLAVWRLTRSALDSVPARLGHVPVYAMGSLAALWMIERSVALIS